MHDKDVKDRSYTAEQAQELERALEAQYRADKDEAAQQDEREQWRQIRRTAAERRFNSAPRKPS
jgi:hypothetical protein